MTRTFPINSQRRLSIRHRIAWSFFLCLILGFSSGCKSFYGIQNWTDYFDRRPEKLEEYPHLTRALLGGEYVLKQDMLLVGDVGRNRYRITFFGRGGLPRSPEDYYAGRGRQRNVYGVVEEGTRIRGDRVERFSDWAAGIYWQGVVYRIETGEHEGTLLTPSSPMISPPWVGTARLSPDMMLQFPSPDILELVKLPYLDVRGRPVSEER